MSDPELDALLGAYALDALAADERARVEEYLVDNPAARREVDEMRESAASLALAPARVDDAVAPPGLWNKISAALGDEPRNVVPLSPKKPGSLPRVLAIAAAIVAIALVGGITFGVASRDSKTGNLAAAFDDAHAQHGAREVALTGADGSVRAHVVLLPDGSGFLKNDDMAALPNDKTYQLWAVSGPPSKPVVISAGVLGADPKTVAFHTDRQVNALGVTVERSPGVVSSTQPMYAQASVT